jgi:hypothetical protein
VNVVGCRLLQLAGYPLGRNDAVGAVEDGPHLGLGGRSLAIPPERGEALRHRLDREYARRSDAGCAQCPDQVRNGFGSTCRQNQRVGRRHDRRQPHCIGVLRNRHDSIAPGLRRQRRATPSATVFSASRSARNGAATARNRPASLKKSHFIREDDDRIRPSPCSGLLAQMSCWASALAYRGEQLIDVARNDLARRPVAALGEPAVDRAGLEVELDRVRPPVAPDLLDEARSRIDLSRVPTAMNRSQAASACSIASSSSGISPNHTTCGRSESRLPHAGQ